MRYPRFTQGSVLGISAAALNDAFDAVKKVQNAPASAAVLRQPDKSTFIARITGLTTDAVQGRDQTNTGTLGQRRIAYFYKWEEIALGVGDFDTATPNGMAVRDTIASNDVVGPTAIGEKVVGAETQKLPAVDFCPVQRYMVGDLVMLHNIIVRAGSKYTRLLAITLLEPLQFLARLTAKHPTIEGLYSWTGLTTATATAGNTVQPAGTVALERAAVNLYELNAIRAANSYSTGLVIGSQSFIGSNNWGHGQSLTGAGATVTKGSLPVGAAGTGTIVLMHRVLHDAATSTQDSSANFCFYAVPPVSAACDP